MEGVASPDRMPLAKALDFFGRLSITAVSSLAAISCVDQSSRDRSLHDEMEVHFVNALTPGRGRVAAPQYTAYPPEEHCERLGRCGQVLLALLVKHSCPACVKRTLVVSLWPCGLYCTALC